MSLITRWVVPKLPQQCFPSAAGLQGNFVKLQIGDRSLMWSDPVCFIAKCFFISGEFARKCYIFNYFLSRQAQEPLISGVPECEWEKRDVVLARGMIHTSEVNQMLVYLGEVALHLPTAFFWGKCSVGEKKGEKKLYKKNPWIQFWRNSADVKFSTRKEGRLAHTFWEFCAWFSWAGSYSVSFSCLKC